GVGGVQPPRRRVAAGHRGPRVNGRALGWPVAVALAFLSLWEASVTLLRVKPVVLPSPTLLGRVLLARGPLLLHALWPPFAADELGFLVSVVGGVLVAVLITYSTIARKGFYPLIVVSQIVPKVAVAPLLVVWFGLGGTSRLLLAFLIAFFPMVINTATGLTGVDDDLVRMARAYMGGRWQIFAQIRP